MKYLLVACVALWLPAQAQISAINYNSSNSGLPYNTVYAITTDNSGIVWCGTDGGLSKFNGSAWTTYTIAQGLPNNAIRSLFAAPNGILWIGTFFSGLVAFDGTTFTTYNTSNSGLPDNFVKSIAFEAPGTLWLGTGGGFAKLKNDTITGYNLTSLGMFSNNVATVAVRPNGNKILGFLNGGFAYYNDTTFTFYNHDNSNLPDNTVLSIALDSLGNPYFAMPTGGIVAHFGGNVWQLYNTNLNPNQITNSFKCLANSPTGIWAGSFDRGLYHKVDFAFENQTSWSNGTVMDTNITCIAVPQQAFQQQVFSAWVGTENGGVYKLDVATGIAETPIDNSVLISFTNNRSQMLVAAKSNIQQVALYTVDGRIIAQMQNGYTNNTTLNLPQLSSGQIILRCVTEDGVAVKKLMVY